MPQKPRRSLSDVARLVQESTHAPEPVRTPQDTPEAPRDALRLAIADELNHMATNTRPPKPKRLNVDLEPDFYDQVQELARRDGRSLSELVRHLLKAYVKLSD